MSEFRDDLSTNFVPRIHKVREITGIQDASRRVCGKALIVEFLNLAV